MAYFKSTAIFNGQKIISYVRYVMRRKHQILLFILFLFIPPPLHADVLEAQPALTLPEGLKIVMDESRALKIAGFSKAIAESDTNVARAGLLPYISASAIHTSLVSQPAMLFAGQSVPVSDKHYYAYSISIQQILFDFRAGLSRYEASRMMLEAQKFDSRRIRTAVALEFTLAFYDYLESQQFVEAGTKEIERLEAHLREADHLYKAGVITRNDLLQVQVKLSDARQKLLSAKNLEAFLASRLNNLLMRPLSSEVNAAEGNRTISAPPGFNLDQAWEKAEKRRPEIQMINRTLEAVDLENTVIRSEFLPKFIVKGSNDYMENPYQAHENNWSLTFVMNMNLYEGGRTTAELQKTKSRKKQLIEQQAKLVDEIKLEIQRYILDLQNAYARIQANREATGQAQENLRINKKRYEEGEGTATEVLDAVTLLTVAETNYIRSVYDYRKAEAATHYALGDDFLEVYQ